MAGPTGQGGRPKLLHKPSPYQFKTTGKEFKMSHLVFFINLLNDISLQDVKKTDRSLEIGRG
jgi:hypothetical protein